MPEEWVRIKKMFVQKDEPSVTISRNGRFSFNTVMKKLAELEKNPYVTFSVIDDKRKIAFEFKSVNDEEDCFKVINVTKQPLCVCSELSKKDWVSKVAELKGQNVFAAKQEGKKWIITLCPAFENHVKREDVKTISTDAFGIYRYLDVGRIVYIGKGNIKDRYNSPERGKWKFDLIEYSIIKDDATAFQWENYWIDKYKISNKGQLPTYNLISGHSE
jgi:hypothetical protein